MKLTLNKQYYELGVNTVIRFYAYGLPDVAAHSRCTVDGEITQNNGHYAIRGHRFWYQLKAHIRLPMSD